MITRREIITQKNNKLKLMTNEIEKLRCIKTNDANLRNMEQKLQNSEDKLRSEVQRKDEALKGLEYQTS